MTSAVEHIRHQGALLAMIIRASFSDSGIHFFTSPDLSQQLAYMQHPAGKQIRAHVHNPVSREVFLTQEVLFIRRGKLRVDFYDNRKKYVESRVLAEGDVILLVSGGHGFEVLEETEMVEVKQGPYIGDQDKTTFDGVDAGRVVLKGNADG
jgi:mannose-6-phosphate isomerase-like protein (cupin superfamily)